MMVADINIVVWSYGEDYWDHSYYIAVRDGLGALYDPAKK
jgi:hypothetical protein